MFLVSCGCISSARGLLSWGFKYVNLGTHQILDRSLTSRARFYPLDTRGAHGHHAVHVRAMASDTMQISKIRPLESSQSRVKVNLLQDEHMYVRTAEQPS